MTPEAFSEISKQGLVAGIAIFLLFEFVRDKRGFNKDVLALLERIAEAVKVRRDK
jgi:hypothetical protein